MITNTLAWIKIFDNVKNWGKKSQAYLRCNNLRLNFDGMMEITIKNDI